MRLILRPGGCCRWSFRIFCGNQFDTIYHEHFSYFSFLTVERVFVRHGLRVFDVKELSTHGGSLRVIACLAAAAHAPTSRMDALRAQEIVQGYDRLDTLPRLRRNYLLILPWNLRSELAEQMAQIRECGGKFVSAIPRVEIWP